MASVPPGTRVAILAEHVDVFLFPPPDRTALHVAIHPGALKAPWSVHTQLVGLEHDEVVWAGALGEDLLQEDGPPYPRARSLLASCLVKGERLWEVIWPGRLLVPEIAEQFSTVYMSDEVRPWIVVGRLDVGDLLAVPLNEAANKQWFTPVLYAGELFLSGAKDSIVELAHVWSLPGGIREGAFIAPGAQQRLEGEIRNYFGS